jgi:transposase InsO family protein
MAPDASPTNGSGAAWGATRSGGGRLMREDKLLCLRARGFGRTTASQHHLVVYPPWLPELAVNGRAPLWVAAITSVRVQRACVYLAVRLDA